MHRRTYAPPLILAAFLLAACSGQTSPAASTSPSAGEPTASASASAAPQPDGAQLPIRAGLPPTELEPGRYAMPRWFRIPLSLELGQGWGGIRDDKARQVNLARGDNAVGRPTLWFGPYAIPTVDVDAFVAELRATPLLTFEEPVPVEVAGYAGEQFDAHAAEDPAEPGNANRVPGTVDITAMHLLHSPGITDFSWYTESVGASLRFILVEVGEETLIIYLEAPPAEFQEFTSRAVRTVLESIRVFPRT